jgi:hypothetical protein
MDSLGNLLASVEARSVALDRTLARARSALRRQLASLDSLRRLRAEGEGGAVEVAAQLEALSRIDLARLAVANQNAVGRLLSYQGTERYAGSGFVISRSGYFVTARNLVWPNQTRADSFVVATVGGQVALRGEVITVASADGPNLAVVLLRDYGGSHIDRLDWSGTSRSGPAALVGAVGAARGETGATAAVQPALSAGRLMDASGTLQFGGVGVEGSSGSAIFNVAGEIVAVDGGDAPERNSRRSAVPLAQLLPLLPPEVKSELGIG